MSVQYHYKKLTLADDYEGPVVATLISVNAVPKASQGLLYIHGYNDYFFQDHLADWANSAGYNFFALDLRKYGRSILPHQKPNMFRDVSEYFEELDLAIDRIRKEGNEKVILLGHSTGGLVAASYANSRNKEKVIDALVLNSPYFEHNIPALARKLLMPLLSAIGKVLPDAITGINLANGYDWSIHKSRHGEWDYDLKLKPFKSFPITFGWIRGLSKAQQKLKHGLDISCPILVLFSSKSVAPGKFNESMHTADAVLNVKHMEKYAGNIGRNVTKISIPDGKHDLSLSKKEAREQYFQSISDFLNKL